MPTPLPDDPYARVLKRLDVIDANLGSIRVMVVALTELLVEFDEDPDPASFTLEGPIKNATRDTNTPL